MQFEYIKNHYHVPAEIGRIVKINGKQGIIVEDRGNYLGVTLDEDKPTIIKSAHPTYLVEYLGLGTPRKLTRSQQRYRRYLKRSECFDSFLDFCRYEAKYKIKLT